MPSRFTLRFDWLSATVGDGPTFIRGPEAGSPSRAGAFETDFFAVPDLVIADGGRPTVLVAAGALRTERFGPGGVFDLDDERGAGAIADRGFAGVGFDFGAYA